MKKTRTEKAILVLEDGTKFEGISFGASGEKTGEIIFNTSMSGYQEILTDPSYKGQIITMTYPLIGNYGINKNDNESRKIFAEGFVVKEYSKIFSNWRGQKSLDSFLKEFNIIGIEGIDTRALTKHIRTAGAMRSIISTKTFDINKLLKKVKESPGLIGRDLVKEVTCKEIYEFKNGAKLEIENRLRIVVIDCGVKYNILRKLKELNCNVIVVPYNTDYDKIIQLKPDGILLSNGPGDPEPVIPVINTVKRIINSKKPIPIFGICLGHQILAIASGGKTYKLKFGHHGGNHPVKDLRTGKINITVQNHGFCVDIDSLNKSEIEITHINLNDNTLEGIKYKNLPMFSVQFHPEAAPGPQDASYLFNEFIDIVKKYKN
jgi:carbamoyl-phosphate synthase small subunit